MADSKMADNKQLVLVMSWEQVTRCKTTIVSPDKYLENLAACVQVRLTSFLKESSAAGGIDMVGDLASQPPLKAQSHDDGPSNMLAFRGARTAKHCKDRLVVCKLYEGGGNLAWMSPGPVTYKKHRFLDVK